MGEIQGTVWTTMLFVVLFFGMVSILFWALDIMNYNSTIYTIEDNLKAGNYSYDGVNVETDVFKTLDDRFNACTLNPVITTDECTGIIEVNKSKRYIKYQVSFDGVMMNRSAATDNDMIVLLPY